MSALTRHRLRNVSLRLESLEKRENPAPIVPAYNSDPTAFAQLYLDFDGHSYPGSWCGYASNVNAPVFSTDGDLTTFSATELSMIDKIWQRVAEDYRPFRINVTTVLPSDFNDKHAVRLSIGKTPGLGSGVAGVACVGSFYNSGPNVAWVITTSFGTNDKSIAMVVSHEAGHTFGLGHQDLPACGGYHPGGTYNGESKGPLMGTPYSSTRDLWWLGFEGCGTQNDMNIISNSSNGFGYVADDIANVSTSARRLRNNSGVLAGNLTGVIHQTSDVDWFAFTSPAGSASITVSPVAIGPNFDAILELYQDVDGTPVLLATADPAGNVFNATINFSVPGGKKYLVVKSDGDYGEVGAYSLSGTVPSGGLIPGPDDGVINTSPMASLFTGVDPRADEPLPSFKELGCGCAQCLAAAAMARAGDEAAALATVAQKQTNAATPAGFTDLLRAEPATIATDLSNQDSKTTSAAAVIRRVLTGTAAINWLGDGVNAVDLSL